MIEITITTEHLDFIKNHAPDLDIGGFSNLAKEDLSKASRLDYQYTGLAGEIAWYIHRYGAHDKLKSLLDYKFNVCRKNNIGDNGFDDSITYNNKTRLVDIKTTHVFDKGKIRYLNLIVPQREYHENMIYVGAFSIGKTRREFDKVILAGWCFNEEITKKWQYDPNKFCVPVNDLKPMKELGQYLGND